MEGRESVFGERGVGESKREKREELLKDDKWGGLLNKVGKEGCCCL